MFSYGEVQLDNLITTKERYNTYMGSLERADGFKKVVNKLQADISKLKRTESVKVKRDVISKLEDELRLFRMMYQAEMDIYNGDEERPKRKFILNDDGYTYRLDPSWKPEREEI